MLQVKPALSWKATVLAINEVPAGARIGYGGIHTAERNMRTAIWLQVTPTEFRIVWATGAK